MCRPQWCLLGNDVRNLGCLQVLTGNAAVLPWCRSNLAPSGQFSNWSRSNTRSRVLEPKCHSHDICGNACTVCVCVVCVMSLHHTGVYVCNVSTSSPNKGTPPRINEVLTPRACQTLLAYIYIYIYMWECLINCESSKMMAKSQMGVTICPWLEIS